MKTILIVDDEDSLLDILADILEGEGYRVVTAANGKDGLARVEAERPDLILSDFMMPIAGGHELIRAARSLPGSQNLPVIMMSASEESIVLSGRLKAGGSTVFLRKPFQLEALLPLIERLIGKGDSVLH
jgi:CheY-like chemotaxis protein